MEILLLNRYCKEKLKVALKSTPSLRQTCRLQKMLRNYQKVVAKNARKTKVKGELKKAEM